MYNSIHIQNSKMPTFYYDIGGSLYKGLNRTTATLSTRALACSIHWLASKSGDTAEHIIAGATVFLVCMYTKVTGAILTFVLV